MKGDVLNVFVTSIKLYLKVTHVLFLFFTFSSLFTGGINFFVPGVSQGVPSLTKKIKIVWHTLSLSVTSGNCKKKKGYNDHSRAAQVKL